MKPSQQLMNLANALVDDILAMTDDEILEEYQEDSDDPEQHEAEMRALFERAVVIAKERRDGVD